MNAIDAGASRRQVLGALAAAAGLPWMAHAGAARRKVGIVGGGMAGVACAWLLDGACDVVLFEALESIGGNVQSLPLVVDGQPVVVDMGAQYFHPGPYPTYVQLLEQLGLYPPSTGESHAFPASITLLDPSEGTPRFVSPILPGRAWPLLAPWNRPGIEAFATTFRAAQRREQLDAPWSLTLGEWLPTLGLSPAQWEGMVLPWAAALCSGDIEQARGLSARAAMVFAAKALPDKPTDPIVYYVLERGLIEALNRMVAQFTTVQMNVATPVSGVSRGAQGGFVVQAGGLATPVDDIVFASSGPQTLQLLSGIGGTALQRAALQGIEFYDAQLMLHTDPAYAPPDKKTWSFLNCQVQGGFCEASMQLADVLTPAPGMPPPNVWKSWVTHRQSLPTQVLHQAGFTHLLSTPATIHAQSLLNTLQGQSGVWFAGGYTQPFDSQESALLSAMSVADGIGASAARMSALKRRRGD
jgi:predicted NAD/FAD-binding protein